MFMPDSPNRGWFLGILLAIILSSGGWIINVFDRTDTLTNNRLEAVENRIHILTEEDGKRDAQNVEIIRRLERIERGIDSVRGKRLNGDHQSP